MPKAPTTCSSLLRPSSHLEGLAPSLLHLLLLFCLILRLPEPSFKALPLPLAPPCLTINTQSLYLAVAPALPHIPELFIIILIWHTPALVSRTWFWRPSWFSLHLTSLPHYSHTPGVFLHCLPKTLPLSRTASTSSSDHCFRIDFKDAHLSFWRCELLPFTSWLWRWSTCSFSRQRHSASPFSFLPGLAWAPCSSLVVSSTRCCSAPSFAVVSLGHPCFEAFHTSFFPVSQSQSSCWGFWFVFFPSCKGLLFVFVSSKGFFLAAALALLLATFEIPFSIAACLLPSFPILAKVYILVAMSFGPFLARVFQTQSCANNCCFEIGWNSCSFFCLGKSAPKKNNLRTFLLTQSEILYCFWQHWRLEIPNHRTFQRWIDEFQKI